MEQLKGGIFITPKDIQILKNCHPSNAQKEHLAIRDSLGKKNKLLTVKEYCQYYELDFDEVVKYLNPYR